jgi:GH25 family lysozyme M1 (1,4-beta-N-acetylmuramidase)
MLQGIDVSSYQGDINIPAIPSDFVIVKATGGNGYVNPWCDPIMQKTIQTGKRKGVYHFRDDGYGDSGAITEANFFVDNIQGYLDGKTLLVLDWEKGNLKDVAWAKAWLDHVFSRTGVKPLIYMSESVIKSADWSPVVNGDYGLWVAKYGQNSGNPETEPNVSPWPFYIMWQYTSKKRLAGYGGDLDHNIFDGSADVWDAYCRPIDKAPVVIPQPPVVVNDPIKPVPVEPTPEPQPELPPEVHTTPSEPSKPESGVDDQPKPKTASQKLLELKTVITNVLITFVEAFIATWTLTGYQLSRGAVGGAIGAAASVVWNTLLKPYLVNNGYIKSK